MTPEQSALVDQVDRALASLGIPHEVTRSIHAVLGTHLGRERAAPPPIDIAAIARSFYKSSIRRTEILGHKLVADMAWNMLLDLFANHAEGRSVSVTSLCIASGGPPTTALRHLDRMVAEGLVRRAADQRDGRRVWVETTEEANRLMREMILSFVVTGDAVPR